MNGVVWVSTNLVADALTADQQLALALLAALDEARDALELRLIDERADGRVLVLRVANLLGLVLHSLLIPLDELIVDALLDIDAGGSEADLAGVGSDGVCGPSNSVIQVAVIENDGGRLATELEGDALQVALGRHL